MSTSNRFEETIIFNLRDLYKKYGYSQYKMSKFEPYDLYARNKEFLVSDGIITFTDTDGTLMALKPDVTLSIVKNFRPENIALQKVCYHENVYRIAGASRTYREIMQTGLECLGTVGMYEISEVICLAINSLLTISNNSLLDISHMGVVSELLSSMNLDENETAAVLRYLGEKNKDALTSLLGIERASKLIAILDISGPISKSLSQLKKIVSGSTLDEIELLAATLAQIGLDEYVNLDFSIINDRNYYNDFVFRGYVEGLPSAVLAGGQYDKLMEKMNKTASGIGFAVYLDQLELLEDRSTDYDVDTIILYDDAENICTLMNIANEYAKNSVMMVKSIPTDIKYRRLLKLSDGGLITIEENG